MLRKTALSALAFAVMSTGAFFGQTTSASASGYGYYSSGNGYYYSCRWINIPVYDYYGNIIRYKRVKICN